MGFTTVIAPRPGTGEITRALVLAVVLLAGIAGLEFAADASGIAATTALGQVAIVIYASVLFFLLRRRTREIREYRDWMDSVSNVGFILLDPQGRIETWTKGAQALFGYSAEDVAGTSFSRLFGTEDLGNKVPEDILRLANGNGTCEHSGWRVRKDGTRFWSTIIVTPLVDDDNRLRGYSNTVRDETLRKIAEDQVQDQHELLESVVNATFDVILLKDRDQRYQMVNAAGALFLGRSRKEIEGCTDADLFNSDDAARNDLNDREVMATGIAQTSEETFQVHGEARTCLVHKTPWRDHTGRIVGVVGTATAITNRKRYVDILQAIPFASHRTDSTSVTVKVAVPADLVVGSSR